MCLRGLRRARTTGTGTQYIRVPPTGVSVRSVFGRYFCVLRLRSRGDRELENFLPKLFLGFSPTQNSSEPVPGVPLYLVPPRPSAECIGQSEVHAPGSPLSNSTSVLK